MKSQGRGKSVSWAIAIVVASIMLMNVEKLHALGGRDSGGGSFAHLNGTYVLVDHLNLPKELEHAYAVHARHTPSRMEQASHLPFAVTSLENADDPAFREAGEIISKWAGVPFDRVGTSIRGAFVKPLKWKFVDDGIPTSPLAYRPNSLPSTTKVVTGAFYSFNDRGDFIVHIDRGIWNQLNIVDQVGLIIHESLRQFQIGQGQDFDDEILQKATVLVNLCEPSVKLDQYVFLLVLQGREVSEKRFGDFTSLASECRRNR